MDVLAVDIGGTKIEVGVVDDAGVVLARHRLATPVGVDPEAVVGILHRCIDAVRNDTAGSGVRPVAVGVGCGGPMRPGGVAVSPLNIPAWRDFPLRDRLGELTGLPVAVDNDAKALALAEGWVGAARGRRDHLALVVSTGVGGGIVLDGRLLDGAAGNAGHIGHVIVEPDGRICGCGARGCLEAEVSGTAIRAITGDDPARADTAMRERTGMLVGRAVASVANLLDVTFATVAGSVALGYGEVFFAAANDELQRRSRLAFSTGARIVPAGLGADGPLVGAAAVGRRAAGLDVGLG